MKLSKIYKQIRKENHLTQQEIANTLNLSRQSICDFENGRTKSSNILSYYLGIADDEDIKEILGVLRGGK